MYGCCFEIIIFYPVLIVENLSRLGSFTYFNSMTYSRTRAPPCPDALSHSCPF
jgi:hypothetical protein